MFHAQEPLFELTLFTGATISGKNVSYDIPPKMQPRSISFPNWKQVLADSSLSPLLKATYAREILSFLKHCKSARTAATVEAAKQYLEWKEKQAFGVRSPLDGGTPGPGPGNA